MFEFCTFSPTFLFLVTYCTGLRYRFSTSNVNEAHNPWHMWPTLRKHLWRHPFGNWTLQRQSDSVLFTELTPLAPNWFLFHHWRGHKILSVGWRNQLHILNSSCSFASLTFPRFEPLTDTLNWSSTLHHRSTIFWFVDIDSHGKPSVQILKSTRYRFSLDSTHSPRSTSRPISPLSASDLSNPVYYHQTSTRRSIFPLSY